MSLNSSRSTASLLSLTSLVLAAPAAAAQSASEMVTGFGPEPALVLAAILVGGALELRRRVNAGMWASRERAFSKRTALATRRSNSPAR